MSSSICCDKMPTFLSFPYVRLKHLEINKRLPNIPVSFGVAFKYLENLGNFRSLIKCFKLFCFDRGYCTIIQVFILNRVAMYSHKGRQLCFCPCLRVFVLIDIL